MVSDPSNIASQALANEPRDLQSRLYREIGIQAVAAALAIDVAPARLDGADYSRVEALDARPVLPAAAAA